MISMLQAASYDNVPALKIGFPTLKLKPTHKLRFLFVECRQTQKNRTNCNAEKFATYEEKE